MKSLNDRMIEVIDNCFKIKQMRLDRSTNIIELDNLYESTVKTIIDVTPDFALNAWLDNKLSDSEVLVGLTVDRNYAENFIENLGGRDND